nr:MAG TPA: hypothetical protein [Caudoviricetes sp.]
MNSKKRDKKAGQTGAGQSGTAPLSRPGWRGFQRSGTAGQHPSLRD